MKYLLTLLAITLTLSLSAQNRYYVVPFDSVAAWLPISQASGIANPDPRCSIDPVDSLCIMEFQISLAPVGANGPYTVTEIRDVLRSTIWTELPDPITGEERVQIDRAFGIQIIDEGIAHGDSLLASGAINQNQYEAWSNDNQWTEILLVLQAGQLKHAADLLNAMANKPFLPSAKQTVLENKIRARVEVLDGIAFE